MQNRDYIRAYFLLNNYNKVIEYAAKQQPKDINDAWAAYRCGESYFLLQQLDKALVWYQRAVAIWPHALDFQSKYGTCLLSMGRVDEAQKVFSFILSENPDYATANTNLAFLYMQQGNLTMAYDLLLRAIRLNPDNEQTLINLAVCYHNNGQDDKARKTLLHLIKKHPQNEQARAMLADLK
jgi:tetratricopeptide (TPR) repeat protein